MMWAGGREGDVGRMQINIIMARSKCVGEESQVG